MSISSQLCFGLFYTILIVAGCSPPADVSTTAPDDAGESYSGKSLDNWTEQYDEMTAVLKLDKDESAKLKSAFESNVEPLKDWYANNGAVLADFEANIIAAVRDKDLGKLKKYKNLAGELRDDVLKLHDKYDRAVENALPQATLWTWLAHKNARRLLKKTESLDLSDEQIEQVNDLALRAVEDSRAEVSPEQTGYGKLLSQFKSRVLDDEQKRKFDEQLKKKPLSFVFGKD